MAANEAKGLNISPTSGGDSSRFVQRQDVLVNRAQQRNCISQRVETLARTVVRRCRLAARQWLKRLLPHPFPVRASLDISAQ